jgi:hypothetical protein
MANSVGALDLCVIFEANSEPKILEKEYGTAILHSDMRWLPNGKFCNVFDD